MSVILWVDGKYIKADHKLVDAFTPGVFKARGVFETMLGVGGKVVDAKAHLGRMQKGLKQLKIKAKLPSLKVVQAVVLRNAHAVSRVRVMVWQEGKDIHQAVMSLRHQFAPDKVLRVMPVKTQLSASRRKADVKSLDYQLFADAFQKAQAQGYDDALLINAKGFVAEASRANIFWVDRGVLCTTPLSSGCLNGIVRQQVLLKARALKVPVKEVPITYFQLKKAQKVFLTNSLMGMIEARCAI